MGGLSPMLPASPPIADQAMRACRKTNGPEGPFVVEAFRSELVLHAQ
jgi:hypothetical protein